MMPSPPKPYEAARPGTGPPASLPRGSSPLPAASGAAAAAAPQLGRPSSAGPAVSQQQQQQATAAAAAAAAAAASAASSPGAGQLVPYGANASAYSRYPGAGGYGAMYSNGGGYGSMYGGGGYGSMYGAGGYGSMYGAGGYGSMYGSSGYGSGFGMYGSRFGMGPGAAGPYGEPHPNTLIKGGYSLINGVEHSVQTFGRISELLHMNFEALHMSFASLLRLLTNASLLRHEMWGMLKSVTTFRFLQIMFHKFRRFFLQLRGRGDAPAAMASEFSAAWDQQEERWAWLPFCLSLALGWWLLKKLWRRMLPPTREQLEREHLEAWQQQQQQFALLQQQYPHLLQLQQQQQQGPPPLPHQVASGLSPESFAALHEQAPGVGWPLAAGLPPGAPGAAGNPPPPSSQPAPSRA